MPEKDRWYMCFSLSHDRDLALQKYQKKYNAQPRQVFQHKYLLWLGPIGGPDGRQ